MTLNVTPIKASCAANLPDKETGDFTYGDSPEAIARDNRRRAIFAAVAVKAYAEATGTIRGEEVGLPISDLLGDLRHLVDCLRAGTEDPDDADYPLDFDVLSERGFGHYDAETRGEP